MCSGKAANEGVVRTESERVKVDKWFIGSGCIELNPNSLHSSSDSCALVSDGDNEEEGLCKCERGMKGSSAKAVPMSPFPHCHF